MTTFAKIVDLVTNLHAALEAWVEIADEGDLRESDDDALDQAKEFLSEAAKGWRYWAVTGRKHGDEEDALHVFHCADRTAAIAAFETAMWEGNGMSEAALQAELKRVRKVMGSEVAVYINSVCASDASIEEC